MQMVPILALLFSAGCALRAPSSETTTPVFAAIAPTTTVPPICIQYDPLERPGQIGHGPGCVTRDIPYIATAHTLCPPDFKSEFTASSCSIRRPNPLSGAGVDTQAFCRRHSWEPMDKPPIATGPGSGMNVYSLTAGGVCPPDQISNCQGYLMSNIPLVAWFDGGCDELPDVYVKNLGIGVAPASPTARLGPLGRRKTTWRVLFDDAHPNGIRTD